MILPSIFVITLLAILVFSAPGTLLRTRPGVPSALGDCSVQGQGAHPVMLSSTLTGEIVLLASSISDIYEVLLTLINSIFYPEASSFCGESIAQFIKHNSPLTKRSAVHFSLGQFVALIWRGITLYLDPVGSQRGSSLCPSWRKDRLIWDAWGVCSGPCRTGSSIVLIFMNIP